jgi:maltoporin
MGLVGTFFKPMLSIRATNHLRFYWESEIGLDLWSQNNPDIGLDDKNSKMAIGIKQRELYNEVNYDQLHLKVGFQTKSTKGNSIDSNDIKPILERLTGISPRILI